jgi:glycosyltransferase involved in cell wall biosynthesis
MIASTSELGGAEQSILNVARHADPARLAPSVLTLMGRGPTATLAHQAGVESVNWALRRTIDPRLWRRMQLFLRRGNYDLVQTFGLRADLLARWVAHGMGLKLISSIRSVDAWRRRRHVWLDRLTADGVTAWISNSEAGKRARVEREGVPADRIFVVRGGIPDRPPADEAARRRARAKLRIGEGEGPVLAVVANLTRAKGHGDLIEAVASLRVSWPRLACLCAGRDDASGRFQAAAESAGVGEAMRWLGFLDDPGPVYDAADLAVLPSHWEGLPHASIEALRAGLPSVATDVGGVGEVVRHEREGLLCPSKQPQALAEAIGRALQDEEARKTWGAAARRRYEESFRVEKMVNELSGVYERVMGARDFK